MLRMKFIKKSSLILVFKREHFKKIMLLQFFVFIETAPHNQNVLSYSNFINK